ncbi:diguanylate cyclase [Carnobacterium iners]|uniref:Diguanylate cyclase n=1 Tax=Carnobacterium iners TaxID=1073423 RepID=A0A1X7N0Q0_9LACT|nr:GGDEF domain-containing protein [Carnobacterium iners]SEK20537.1 diguanylate cyclase [Carnobacterium iners]SMH30321.1 diguanylate cyclase [Carnobacterium iners]
MMSYLGIKLIPNERNFILNKKQKILIFLFAGLTSFIVMSFSLDLPENMKIDLRHVIIIFLVHYFGPTFSIPITIFVSILRLYWGVNQASVLSATAYILIGVILSVLYKYLPTFINRCATLILFNTLFVVTAGFNVYYLTGNILFSLNVFFLFWLISTTVVVLEKLFVDDMIRNRQMYLSEKEYAKRDYLTGLLNMREFNRQWQLNQKNDTYYNTAFLMLDVDHFKLINDTYGHPNGNLVLQQLAMILRINAPDTEQIYRIGGEEFCLILTNYTASELNDLAEKVRAVVASNPFKLEEDNSVEVTVSIGLASTGNKDLKKLYRLADRCLYQAKDQGRNRVVALSM